MSRLLALTAAALITALALSTPSHAVPVRSNFAVEITSTQMSPPNVGDLLEGFVTFDSAFLGTAQTLAPPDVSLSFDAFGVTLTEEDVVAVPGFPEIEITAGGQVAGIEFVVFEPFNEFDQGFGIVLTGLDAELGLPNLDASGVVIPGSVQVIPLPAALGPMALALLGLVAVARRRMA